MLWLLIGGFNLNTVADLNYRICIHLVGGVDSRINRDRVHAEEAEVQSVDAHESVVVSLESASVNYNILISMWICSTNTDILWWFIFSLLIIIVCCKLRQFNTLPPMTTICPRSKWTGQQCTWGDHKIHIYLRITDIYTEITQYEEV